MKNWRKYRALISLLWRILVRVEKSNDDFGMDLFILRFKFVNALLFWGTYNVLANEGAYSCQYKLALADWKVFQNT